MFRLFKKRKYNLTLNRVHDSVTIKEGTDTLDLQVESDPDRIIAGLSAANKALRAINDNSTDEETRNAARMLAACIFGEEQADKLLAFYHDDPGCVIRACSMYFSKRLSHLITDAQKRRREADEHE